MKKNISLLMIFVLTGSCVVASEGTLPGLDEQRVAAATSLSSEASGKDTVKNTKEELIAAGLPSDKEESDLPGDDNSSFDRVENLLWKPFSYGMQLAYGMAGRAMELAKRTRQSLEESSEDHLKESAGNLDAEKNADAGSQPGGSKEKGFFDKLGCFPSSSLQPSATDSDLEETTEDSKR